LLSPLKFWFAPQTGSPVLGAELTAGAEVVIGADVVLVLGAEVELGVDVVGADVDEHLETG